MAAIVAGVAVMAAEEAEDTTTVEVNLFLQFQSYPVQVNDIEIVVKFFISAIT